MFEIATREKYRFETVKGNISAEDLWDLPLISKDSTFCLDGLAKGLNRELKESAEESFVVEKSAENSTLELKFSIVKHIIRTKLKESAERETEAVNKAKRDKIINILADKEDEGLKGKSEDELRAMLDDL